MNRLTLELSGDKIPLAERIKYNFYMSLVESRIDCGFSQTKLAELSGLSQAAIAKIERGNANPTINTIIKLAAALDLSIEVAPRGTARRNRDLLY